MSNNDIDALLSDYYGVDIEEENTQQNNLEQANQATNANNASTTTSFMGEMLDFVPGADAINTLLTKTANFVGNSVNKDKEHANKVKPETFDLNSAAFDVQTYLQMEVKHKHVDDLHSLQKEMNQTVNKHDHDMQSLVNKNYEKFVLATTTVKNLKTDVECCEPEMKNLFTQTDHITAVSSQLEVKLSGNKSKIDKLVSVRRLLKKVEFLFELPSRLQQCIKLGAYSQAVRYYQLAGKILGNLSHFKSFEAIGKEAESIIHSLKVTLKTSIKDSKASSISQLENTQLLLELDESPATLWSDLLEGRQIKLLNELHKALLAAQSSTAVDASATAGSSTIDASGHSLLLNYMLNYFITEFFEFTDAFCHLFCDTTKVDAETAREASAGLVKFVRALFAEFFSHSQKALHLAAEAAVYAKRKDPFAPFIDDLSSFYSQVNRAAQLVPAARLKDKAGEIVEKALRHCVECVFSATSNSIASVLRTLHANVLTLSTSIDADIKASFNSRSNPAPTPSSAASTPAIPAAASAAPTPSLQKPALHRTVTSPVRNLGSATTAVTAVDDSIIKPVAAQRTQDADVLRTDLATGPGNEIVLIIHDALQSLVPLLTSDIVSNIVETPLASLVHSHHKHAFLHFTSLLLQDSVRFSEGHVHSVRSTGWAHDLSNGGSTPPMFYLVLSQLCSFMENRGVSNCAMFLQDAFPIDDSNPTSLGSGSSLNESSPSDDLYAITQDLKEASQLLIRKFAECHGETLAKFANDRFMSKASSSQLSVSPWVYDFLRELKIVESELAKLFPKAAVTSAPTRNVNNNNNNSANMMGKLFSTPSRSAIFGAVKPTRSSPLVAVCKIVFKEWLEHVRLLRISEEAVKLLQVNIYAIVASLPLHIAQDEHDLLVSMLEDIVKSSVDRCVVDTTEDASLQQRIHLGSNGLPEFI